MVVYCILLLSLEGMIRKRQQENSRGMVHTGKSTNSTGEKDEKWGNIEVESGLRGKGKWKPCAGIYNSCQSLTER